MTDQDRHSAQPLDYAPPAPRRRSWLERAALSLAQDAYSAVWVMILFAGGVVLLMLEMDEIGTFIACFAWLLGMVFLHRLARRWLR